MAAKEIIQANHLVVVPEKILAEVGADEAGAAGDEDFRAGDFLKNIFDSE